MCDCEDKYKHVLERYIVCVKCQEKWKKEEVK